MIGQLWVYCSVVAQLDGLGDWIQTIIFLLVVGSAALGSIAKVLIRKFSPKEPPGPAKLDRRTAPRRQRPVPPLARPVARPMPQRPTPQAQAPPPVASPMGPQPKLDQPRVDSLPEMLREVFSQLTDTVETVQPRPPHPARPVGGPGQRPTPPRPKRSRRRPAHPLGRTLPEAAPKTRRDMLAGRPGGTEGLLDGLAMSWDSAYELPAQDGIQKSKGRGFQPGAIQHQTRASLRRAIIMSEVLGPPLAIRPPDERW